MSSLENLAVAYNLLSGTLPPELSMGAMRTDLHIDVMGNERLSGTIPHTYSRFSSGALLLYGTNVTGCIPDGLPTETSNPHVPCSTDIGTSDTMLLAALKQVLVNVGVETTALKMWDVHYPSHAGECCTQYKIC
jgi:hypothetical protein